jgi:hypothetical protein
MAKDGHKEVKEQIILKGLGLGMIKFGFGFGFELIKLKISDEMSRVHHILYRIYLRLDNLFDDFHRLFIRGFIKSFHIDF